jgi:hypothetical protein
VIDLASLFCAPAADGAPTTGFAGATRGTVAAANGSALVDAFDTADCRCLFWRGAGADAAELRLPGRFALTTPAAGGWLLAAADHGQPSYWLPQLPVLRRIDPQGRVFQEQAARIRSFAIAEAEVSAAFEAPAGQVFDLVLWQIGPTASGIARELETLAPGEDQPTFLWGSHGVYRLPANLYRHLLHGSVFDLRFSWPHKRRAYSENEAHALHLTLRNRELATGKRVYRLLREQVVLSVLARQDADGAWRQGIWTPDMECHFRLHCSAMHMLMDSEAERPDASIRAALARAARFVAGQAERYLGETWYLHDSLEQSEEAMRREMPDWDRCTRDGKSPGNTLVLNTHIDTLLALDRYRALTGDTAYESGTESARRLLLRLLGMRPAEWLYRLLTAPLYLTVLPAVRARRLPLPIRALKRYARQLMAPLLTWAKCRYPRLVMPGGFLDRALSLKRFAHPYHSINLMDLVRYRHRFRAEPGVDAIITEALRFTDTHDLLAYWAETPPARYAIGFWVEALYQLALSDRDPRHRQSLARAALLADDLGLGLPPSLAGTNLELLAIDDQKPCPLVGAGLRVINLGSGRQGEYLFLNPGKETLPFAAPAGLANGWRWSAGATPSPTPPAFLAAGAWVLAEEDAGG